MVENPEQSKGKSHFEWEIDKQNLSWKSKLKLAIDEVIKESENFEDFLSKCADFGVLVDYNPEHKIDLKFILSEQKERNPRAKFTRAKTLGWFYETEQIKKRIEQYKGVMIYVPRFKIKVVTEKPQNKFIQNSIDLGNMKVTSKALNEMTADNSTLEELENAVHSAFAKKMAASSAMNNLRKRWDETQELLPLVKDFTNYFEIYKNFRSLEGKEKKKYGEEFSYEISEYKRLMEKIREYIPQGAIPSVSVLKKRLEQIQKEYGEQDNIYKSAKKESDRLARQIQVKRESQKALDRYLQNEQESSQKKKNEIE